MCVFVICNTSLQLVKGTRWPPLSSTVMKITHKYQFSLYFRTVAAHHLSSMLHRPQRENTDGKRPRGEDPVMLAISSLLSWYSLHAVLCAAFNYISIKCRSSPFSSVSPAILVITIQQGPIYINLKCHHLFYNFMNSLIKDSRRNYSDSFTYGQ